VPASALIRRTFPQTKKRNLRKQRRSTATSQVRYVELSRTVEKIDQPERDEWHIGAKGQHEEQRGNVGDIDLRRIPNVGFGDGTGGHQHARDRRRLLADGKVQRYHQAKVNGI